MKTKTTKNKRVTKKDFEDGSIIVKVSGVNSQLVSFEFTKVFHSYGHLQDYEFYKGRRNNCIYEIV